MYGVYVQRLQEKPDSLANLVIPAPFTQGMWKIHHYPHNGLTHYWREQSRA